MSPDSAPQPNKRVLRIGKYEVIEHVATGGMGAVYRARDTELDRIVALKILQAELAAKPLLLERFRREARHAARLRHENIVTIYEYGVYRDTHYLALEFVDGTDLDDLIEQRGRLDPEEVRQIGVQAARALAHAHKHGVIHRDIKPANFLLTQVDGRMIIKLADFGLARIENDDDFKVTRDGSTVGTIDYIAPEQSRDSRAADTRSDIYALGCTLYHLLTGQAPYPEGGLGERLLKHLEAPPPDVRALNPSVSAAFTTVLWKMLAKKPSNRYQTPTELLAALESVEASTPEPLPDFLEVLPEEPGREPKKARPRKRRSSGERRATPIERSEEAETPRSPVRSNASAKGAALPRPRGGQEARNDVSDKTKGNLPTQRPRPTPTRDRQPRLPWLIVSLLAVLLLVGAAVGVVMMMLPPGDETGATQPVANAGTLPEPVAIAETRPATEPRPETRPEPRSTTMRETRTTERTVSPAVPKSKWPYLYPGAASLQAEPLWKEATTPWDNASATPALPILRLTRVATGVANTFDTLAAAIAAAPADRVTALEIDDNGPLFLTPAVASGRSLVLRAGKGFRPLLVWDVGATKTEPGGTPPTLLTVRQGSLTLEGLDFAFEGFDSTRPSALFRVADGDFTATDCTFSIAGWQRAGVVLAAIEQPEMKRARCRLTRCVGRGANLIALETPATGVETLIEGCLMAGGDQPLFRVGPRGGGGEPTTLRFMRSTLVASQTLLEARLPEPGPETLLRVFVWDSLLTRSATQSGGQMLALPEGSAKRIDWHAVNALYVGWKTLLGGPEPVSDLDGWRTRWPSEADAVEPQPWPAGVPDLAEVLPEAFHPDRTVAFMATSGPGMLGCDLERLPPVRDGWQRWTVRRFVGVLPDTPHDGVPEIPDPGDGNYHGERLDLDRIGDLGVYLRGVVKERTLGPKVVLHLVGSGSKNTTPFRVVNASLVLYFVPPTDAKLPPLTLFAPGVAAGQEGLVEVENGTLEVCNGSIRYEDFPTALLPPYLLRVRGGDLKLYNCRLIGPTKAPPATFRGVARVDGSGKLGRDNMRSLAAADTVFLSARDGVHLTNVGVTASLSQCVILCGEDGIRLEPKLSDGRAGMLCGLERCTVAARGAVVRLVDGGSTELPREPAVVQTRACVFLNPFTKDDGRTPLSAGLLRCEGAALMRGLLVWQSEDDVYDKRLFYAAAVTPPSQPEPLSAWRGLWGSTNVTKAILDVDFRRPAELKLEHLDRLALPSASRFSRRPGADLARLTGVRKP